jgi:hypothetical protein
VLRSLAAVSCVRAPVAGKRVASTEPAAFASVMTATRTVTATGPRSPVVCSRNAP